MEHRTIRAETEARLTRALRKAGKATRAKILRVAGNPPDITRVTPSLWDELEREQTRIATLLLFYLMRRTWFSMRSTIGVDPTRSPFGPTSEQVTQAFVDGARQRSSAVFTARARRLEDAALGEADLDSALSSLGSTREAARISVTETTAAIASTELLYIDEVELTVKATTQTADQLSRPVTSIDREPPRLPPFTKEPRNSELFLIRWYTQQDQRVCPVCGPLHRTDQSTWQREFSYGPPAHPNCRCWLTYERAGDIASLPPGEFGLPETA